MNRSNPTKSSTGSTKEQYPGGNGNNNRETNTWIGRTALAVPKIAPTSHTMESYDDPRSMILKRQGSNGVGVKHPKTSFFAMKNMLSNWLVGTIPPKRM